MSTQHEKPSRRPCVDCGTRKGKLRRFCPRCDEPVCDGCYPIDHKCRGRLPQGRRP